MTKRFRMVAGPNGSGKSSLVAWLQDEFAVNFYTFLNADDIFAMLKRDGAYLPKFPIDKDELLAYVDASTYDAKTKAVFRGDGVRVDGDCVRFASAAVNSYSVALFTGFLQDGFIRRGESFSQETVFSHPSKIAALERAKKTGYRTYLYFVATSDPLINRHRVALRAAQGGHDVPDEKILARYSRSLAQVKLALPFLSRAFFFDNSGAEMRYVGQYAEGEGFSYAGCQAGQLPSWFKDAVE